MRKRAGWPTPPLPPPWDEVEVSEVGIGGSIASSDRYPELHPCPLRGALGISEQEGGFPSTTTMGVSML